MSTEHHIAVQRTARYFTMGEGGPATREVWFVLHGYGQLAERFLASCMALEGPQRLVIAPEALSRFYTIAPGDLPAAERPVGATWMTREDREREIADYVAYLDDVYQRIIEPLGRERLRVVVLGFSQGTATAARWLARGGRVAVDELVLWGGTIPPELEPGMLRALLRAPVTLVAGTRDHFLRPELLDGEAARLAAAGVPHRVRRFDGAHRMDGGVLAEIAASPMPRLQPAPGC